MHPNPLSPHDLKIQVKEVGQGPLWYSYLEYNRDQPSIRHAWMVI